MPLDEASIDEYIVEVDDFVEQSIRSGVACAEYGTILPPARVSEAARWQQHVATHGFAGIDWGEHHHGRGLSEAHSIAWYASCARHSVAPYANFQGYVLTAGALRTFGTSTQCDAHLPGILDGSTIWCQLFSEPDAGSDLSSLMTRAEPDGDGWRISGQKIWTSTAQVSQMGILLARTAPEESGARGISFLLIDMNQPEITVRPITQMTGDAEFCEVFLDGAFVPAEGLVGELNGGWRVATSVLADERAAVGAASVRLDRRLAALSRNAAGLLDRGRALRFMLERTGTNPTLGPLSKLALTEFETSLTRHLIETEGANGMVDNDATEAFLYAPGMRVAGGTSEVQRDLIGERLLGLPRAPRA